MAKLVTKFKYLKPDARQGRGGYAKYIATRDGVEKIDDSRKIAPVTWNQKKLIAKILRDFPDSKEMLEYEDYQQKQTVESASEFISRAIEDNAAVALNAKTYADYIATRPRAERFGSHGLFTDDGVQVNLKQVSQELNNYVGNVWTVIISLRREDAERLGFDNGSRWRDMLRSQTQALSENLRISMGHLKWFAAFHNESHHPHVHLIAYSTVESEGYLTKQGVQKLRSSFAKDIFAQDLLCIYEKQTEHRNRLRSESRDILTEIVSQINAGEYSNPHLEEMLLQLARRLSRTKGKKVYGYLKADVKAIVDSIVDELAKDNRISALYDLWYEQRENVLRAYNGSLPERVPLSQNKEFKTIKNAVIQAAMNLILDSQQELSTTEDKASSRQERSSSVAGIGISALRLVQQTSQILQNEVRPIYQDRRVDRKLRRKINEKKTGAGVTAIKNRKREPLRWVWLFLLERSFMSGYIPFTDEQKEKARRTDLAGLLRSQGETLRKSGSELEWLDGSQKVTIRGNLWFHQYEQVGGDSIDFVRKFYHKSYPEAMEYLLGQNGGMLSVMPPVRKAPPKFELPPANDNMRRVFAYLLNRRGIDKEVLYAFVHKKMVYESAQYHNAVFVGFDKDSNPRHANKRGTGSASTYKGNAAGSVPEYSFHWNGKSNRLYLFEAPIDMLSFISMNKDGWRDHSYAAACSISDKVLFQCLTDNPSINKVSICFDSDEPGQLAAQRITAKLIMQGIDSEILVPVNKDWNEDLLCGEGLEVEESCQILRH